MLTASPVALQHRNRSPPPRAPLVPLVFSHLIESLVFVPIMLGVLFFLFEFFNNDQLLAFVVLLAFWCAEVFLVLGTRTVTSIRIFPRVYFLAHLLFFSYFLSHPMGFTYVAFAASEGFVAFCILALWDRHELPALASGAISRAHPRSLREAGVMFGGHGPITARRVRVMRQGLQVPAELQARLQEALAQAGRQPGQTVTFTTNLRAAVPPGTAAAQAAQAGQAAAMPAAAQPVAQATSANAGAGEGAGEGAGAGAQPQSVAATAIDEAAVHGVPLIPPQFMATAAIPAAHSSMAASGISFTTVAGGPPTPAAMTGGTAAPAAAAAPTPEALLAAQQLLQGFSALAGMQQQPPPSE